MKIIFTAIVKNESKILQRCLDSVKDVVDAFCIIDTGSTDNTVELINKYLENRTGIVVQQEWKNFGHNRTLGLHTTRDYAKNTLNWDLADSYALTLDADMVLTGAGLNRLNLKEAGYSIVQVNREVEYPNVRLLRLDVNWVSSGVTHEVWTGANPLVFPKNVCRIDDINDGGAKSDKYTRDLQLLKQGVIDEPNNARYMFYLAQTYRDLNLIEPAIEHYKKRLEMAGWDEERWYSMYMIGKSYLLNTKNETDGEQWLLKAHAYNSKRAEPMYYLSKYFRENGNHHKAFVYCSTGRAIKNPDSHLFIEKPIYDHLLDLEMTIILYYTNPDRRIGLIECIKYLSDHSHHAEIVLGNVVHYVNTISAILEPFSTFHDALGFDYHPSSISVCDGVYNIRYVNYSINQKNGSYMMKDGDYSIYHPVRTKNLAIHKNGMTVIEGHTPLKENIIQGLEDVRLYKNKNNELSFVASSAEYTDGIQIVGGKYNLGAGRVENCKVIGSPMDNLVEKNWLPISGTNHIIYKWAPLEIGSVVNDKLKIHTKYETPGFFQLLRGSAVPIKVGNELWALTHFVINTAPRTYIHCFVSLDPTTYNPTKMSLPFVFRQKTIEYCLGVESVSESEIRCLVSTMDDNPVKLTIKHSDITWIPIGAKLIYREDVQEVSLPLDA